MNTEYRIQTFCGFIQEPLHILQVRRVLVGIMYMVDIELTESGCRFKLAKFWVYLNAFAVGAGLLTYRCRRRVSRMSVPNICM